MNLIMLNSLFSIIWNIDDADKLKSQIEIILCGKWFTKEEQLAELNGCAILRP